MNPSKTWYAPYEIYFSRPQILFLLQNLELLEAGQYPRQPSGYIDSPDMPRQTRFSKGASFTRPIELAAEVNYRVTQTGYDGAILRGRYQFDQTIIELSKQYHKPIWVIYMRINRALSYCSGWTRRQISYKDWINGKRFLKRQKASFNLKS